MITVADAKPKTNVYHIYSRNSYEKCKFLLGKIKWHFKMGGYALYPVIKIFDLITLKEITSFITELMTGKEDLINANHHNFNLPWCNDNSRNTTAV